MAMKSGNLPAALDGLRALLADETAVIQVRREAAAMVAQLQEQGPNAATAAWLRSPATSSEIQDSELRQYLAGLAARNSADGAPAEYKNLIASLQQIPYARLAATRILKLRNAGIAPDAVAEAIQHLLYLNPAMRTERVAMFHWLRENNRARMALAVINQQDFWEGGYYFAGRRVASAAVEGESFTGMNPLSGYDLGPKETYDLALAISQAAAQEGLQNLAEYYARLAGYLAPEDSSQKAAVARLRELEQRRKAREAQRAGIYHLQPSLKSSQETNP
jgi:hypothetical protein